MRLLNNFIIRNLPGTQNTKGGNTNERYNEYSERRQGIQHPQTP